MMAECDFCPSKEEKPEVGMPEGWARWLVSSNVYLTFCRACVPRVAQFLTQKLKDTVDKVDHESYHIDVDYSERGDRVAVLVPNRDCPYCLAQTEREVAEVEGLASQAQAENAAADKEAYDVRERDSDAPVN